MSLSVKWTLNVQSRTKSSNLFGVCLLHTGTGDLAAMVSLCQESSLSLGSIPGSVSPYFLQGHRFLLTTCLFHDTNSNIYCIFNLPRATRSQYCCHTCQWARTAEFQAGQSTSLPVVAISLGGPCHLASNCFHRHYAFCPYTSSSRIFMSRSLSLTSSSIATLANSLRLGSFVPNFPSNNSSDEHTCTLVRRVPRGN